jgi:hypothetical protein
MKTVKLPLILLGLLISVNSVNSQLVVVPGSETLLDKLRLNKGVQGIQYETYTTTVGDPFLYKKFHEGEIIFKNGETYKLNLRYDIYSDQVHLKDNDKIYGIIHPEALASISIDTLKLLYCNFVRSPADQSFEAGYFILKTDGKCKLLVRKKIRIQDSEPPKGLQEARPSRFVAMDDAYYVKQEGKSTAVRINGKKDLLTVLEDRKEEINRLIKSEKLKAKSEADLTKIVTFYNSL